MPRRSVNIIASALILTAVCIIGCEQAEDILTPVGTSMIYLEPERLPTTPNGMVYELWTVNWTSTDRSSKDTVSLGRFAFNYTTEKFLTENRQARPDSNMFVVSDDILSTYTDDRDRKFLKYTNLFISAENVPDADLSRPANIMLTDTVSVTSDDPISMVFPMIDDLWAATVRFNMETPSDGRIPAFDGYGIWFSNYTEEEATIQDTVGYSFVIDTIMKDFPGKDTVVESVVDIVNIRQETAEKIFGLDTVYQEVVRRDLVRESDSTSPYLTTDVTEIWTTSGPVDTLTYDNFTQDKFNFPDYSAYGFQYKGWIVTPHVSTAAGSFSPPAWPLYGNVLYDVFPGASGGMITTGTFRWVDSTDDANPHVQGGKIPKFPGEDFFQNLPAGAPAPLNLVPAGSSVNGTAFITLEPINFTGQNTNFPLIAFARSLPTTRTAVESTTQQFTMRGWMFSDDPYRGFPKITAKIERK